ncbi:Hsp70 family protein [Algoriphagus aquimarinus]|uniref:Hsp70 family protein n=1 Tax=Algoriphagus aquimarinus TaxID=237018 RepID=UPI0030DB2008|tara:strand:- start:50488 stop:52986 length:2499 start_codon:yes stop_codon:yes gene_type:complete
MDIYDQLVAGIGKKMPSSETVEAHLQSLKPSVTCLRKAYFNYPVYVPYERHNIQEAYLLAYFPHYYQLMYSILNNQIGDLFVGKEKVNLGFVGGGPGSEAYGAIKYILNNCNDIREIGITIFDLNSSTWKYSHEVVLGSLIEPLKKSEFPKISWDTVSLDLANPSDIEKILPKVSSLDLLVMQNCINEIPLNSISDLKRNIARLFKGLRSSSCLVISDLTRSVRPLLKSIEQEVEKSGEVKFKISTLENNHASLQVSVHAVPNRVIKENLLTGDSTKYLIPRKNLQYDYCLFSRMEIEGKDEEGIGSKDFGFMNLYSPLKHSRVDANNYVNTKSFIGIDFGTSTTVVSVAFLNEGELIVKSIPISQKDSEGRLSKDTLVPTVMALIGKSTFMVGKHAADRKAIMAYGKNIWYGFKENLEFLHSDNYPDSLLKDKPDFRIANAKDALILFFKYLKKQVDEFLILENLPLEAEYSVTIPASFEYSKKSMLRECLNFAGINYEGDKPFIEEPTAALINYLFESKDPIELESESKTFLILDVGAGTVDVSIINLEKELEGASSKLLAVSRKGSIGGNLLDEYLAVFLVGGQHNYNGLSESEKKAILKNSENLKIKLCKEIHLDSTNNFALPSISISSQSVSIGAISITFSEFSIVFRKYWEEIKDTILDAFTKASLRVEVIDGVILNGGGSKNPYLQGFVREFFIEAQIIRPDNIQEHVSKGAALNSFVLNSYGKQIISNVLSSPVYVFVEEEDNWKEIISPGELIPTIEARLDPTKVLLKFNNMMQIKHNGHKSCFHVPLDLNPTELVVYINIDNDPECEAIFASGSQKIAQLNF